MTPARSFRLLHSSLRTSNRIGPPDPISHLRPTLYDDPVTSPRASTRTTHPYSLFEFASADISTDDYELQQKLHQQQLDSFHQEFWTDTNSRFEAAKAVVLSSLPESSSALDSERALSELYKQWLKQETQRMDAYTTEWRWRNFGSLMLDTRVAYHKLTSRISKVLEKWT